VASENVGLVRAIYAEWERGDFSSTEWAHSDIEYVMIDGAHTRELEGSRRHDGKLARVP
jgi:hypothetical protein